MKVFRKMFAFAVTVAAIAMATSAFAATAEYDATNKLVKVADTSALNNETAQATVAVVKSTFNGTNDADIYFIDQDAVATIKANLVAGLAVKDELVNPAENYEVRVAGTGTAMQRINFETVQSTTIDKVQIVGAGAAVKAVGIKGEFTYNGGGETVVLTLKDTVNLVNGEPAIGTVTWDLGSIASSNAPLVFGLEIQSATEMDMRGIEYVGFTAQ